MGWNIERSKEGEGMFQQREGDKHKKTSDPQVKIIHVHHSVNTSQPSISKNIFPLIITCIFIVDVCFLLILQINGFSPAPMDLHNITLSRELQVCSASI